MNDCPTDVHAEFWASFTAIRESLYVIENLDDPWEDDYSRLLSELESLNAYLGQAMEAAALATE